MTENINALGKLQSEKMRIARPQRLSSGSVFTVLLILAGIGFLLYANSLQNEFMWDDFTLIPGNQYVKSYKNIPLFLTHHYWNILHPIKGRADYRPVRAITFALDYFFWKDNPTGYHLTNLLFHIVNTVLVYFLICALAPGAMYISNEKSISCRHLAILTALLFVAHPIHAESVTYIKNRSEILSFLFFLTAFLFFIKTTLSQEKKKAVIFYLTALICFCLALFSKESALVLPAVLILYAICFCAKGKRYSAILQTIPFWGGSLLFFWFRQTVLLKTPTCLEAIKADPGYWHPVLIIFKTVGYYLYLLFFPVNLTVEHFFSVPRSLFSPSVFFSAVALFFLFFAIFVSYKKKSLWLCFGISWVLLTLLPAANVVFLVSRPIAEQRLYLPSLGVCLLLSLGILQIFTGGKKFCSAHRFVAVFVFCAVFIFFSIKLIARNYDWRTSLSLWHDCARKSPQTASPYKNLGRAYAKKEDYDKAIKNFQQVLKRFDFLEPSHPEIIMTNRILGEVYRRKKDYDNALLYFQKALESSMDARRPDFVVASIYNELGVACEEKGDRALALAYYQKALRLRIAGLGPNHPETGESYHILGCFYEAGGDHNKAIGFFQQSLDIIERTVGPDAPVAGFAYKLVGDIYKAAGNFPNAVENYQQALSILEAAGSAPAAVAEIYNRLGVIFYKNGDYNKAEDYYQRALDLNTRQLGFDHQTIVFGYNNLAGVYYRQGDLAQAIACLQKSLQLAGDYLPPDHPSLVSLRKNIKNIWREKENSASGQ